jgi:hypothetical protein
MSSGNVISHENTCYSAVAMPRRATGSIATRLINSKSCMQLTRPAMAITCGVSFFYGGFAVVYAL